MTCVFVFEATQGPRVGGGALGTLGRDSHIDAADGYFSSIPAWVQFSAPARGALRGSGWWWAFFYKNVANGVKCYDNVMFIMQEGGGASHL